MIGDIPADVFHQPAFHHMLRGGLAFFQKEGKKAVQNRKGI